MHVYCIVYDYNIVGVSLIDNIVHFVRNNEVQNEITYPTSSTKEHIQQFDIYIYFYYICTEIILILYVGTWLIYRI